MSGPTRVQRKRRRGWKMPDGAIYVGRPSRWGNPYWITRSSDYHGLAGSWFVLGPDGATHHPGEDTEAAARATSVTLYAADLAAGRGAVTEAHARAELAGRTLVCWCPLDQPCHADVLLAVSNRPATTSTDPRNQPVEEPDAGPSTRSVDLGGPTARECVDRSNDR